jgi:2-desacetyl-2-hydroxyethyl bacteriochlorophyllide A dehydrogenase
MKAMVLRGPGKLRLEEVPRPQVPPGHVLVRITHSGLCGTDLKIYQGAIPAQYPLIMGHEMIGEIVEGEAAGARVIVDPVLFCGTCFHCRNGQTNLCPSGGLIGRERNGGFAEYAAVPAAQVFRLPDSIDSRTAPLIQVATTCLHGQRLTPLFLGDSVAVIGLGVSGQLHVQLAKARGAGHVIGISRSAFKNDLAKQLGADVTIEAGPGAVDKVLEATGGRGVDVVVECTGLLASVADAIRMVRFGGRILLFGIISAKQGALPFYDLYFKEITLINNRAATAQDFPGMIDLVERGVVRLEPLVTHGLKLEELEAALGMVEDGGAGRLKIILDHTILDHTAGR